MLRTINKRLYSVLYLSVEVEKGHRYDYCDKVQYVERIHEILFLDFIIGGYLTGKYSITLMSVAKGSSSCRRYDIEGVSENKTEDEITDSHFNERKEHGYSC